MVAATRLRGSDPDRRAKGPRLAPGATIAIPSPASPVSAAAAAKIEEEGFALRFAEEATGPDERAALVTDAFADPDVGAILWDATPSRCAELLRRLDYDVVAENPKPFVGAGDATVLHVAFARAAGLVTFWGPLLPELAEPSTRRSLLHALTRFEPAGSEAGESLTPGIAEAELAGGTPAALCSLMGTPWELETRGRIVLLAAPAQTPWRIYSNLLHLVNAGKLQACAGLYLTGIGSEGVARELVASVVEPLGIPTVLAPQSAPRVPTLPLGARVRLDAYSGRLDVLEAGIS